MAEILEFARNLIEATPVGIVTYDASGQCVSANEAAARITGATIAQLLSQNFREIESWKGSGLLDTAEKTLATKRGHRVVACCTAGFGKPVRLENQLETFVANGERYLLRVISEESTLERVPDSELGTEE